ncbi:MAG: tyrosine/phenylalanine carboxypeptidase domain-containing protein [Oligoflexus sp.]
MKKTQRLLEKLSHTNQVILNTGRQVRILETINWQDDLCRQAIARFRKQDYFIPKQDYSKQDFGTVKETLLAVSQIKEGEHPLVQYLARMADAYVVAIKMLEGIGEESFTQNSMQLYGNPRDILPGFRLSYLDVAKKMLSYCKDFEQDFGRKQEESWQPLRVKEFFEAEAQRSFPGESIDVQLDDKMSALAAVSQSRIKINSSGQYTRVLARQLWFHEAEVHLLTSLNGQSQRLVSALSLSHPASTIDQEGLASFSELMTETIDFYRLERLALRVVAIDMALQGADFVEVYQFFCERGQSVESSFYATARVFRGGNPRGVVAFTKDIVYVAGLLRVFNHFRSAILKKDLNLIDMVFCGKINLDDIPLLREALAEGMIDKPKYLPSWASSKECLAASLIFMSFIDKLQER